MNTANVLRDLRCAVESNSLCVDNSAATLTALDAAIASLSGNLDQTMEKQESESVTLSDRYNEALRIMADVLHYLRRLPAVPVTTQLCTKMQEYLDEPGAALNALYQGKREGIIVSSIGLPIAHATLIKNDLSLRLPAPVTGSIPLQGSKPYHFTIQQHVEIPLHSISADYKNLSWVYP